MPQTAIKGVCRDGRIIPLEDIPFDDAMRVIIVFTGKYDEEDRYETHGWQIAEKRASEDYKAGRTKSANSIDEMFKEIESNLDAG